MQTLNDKQPLAATQLAAGKTAREVAENIGVTPETISHWKRDARFEALLNEIRWEALETGREALRAACKEAVTGLVDLARTAKNEEVRRKACVDVLEMTGLKKQGAEDFGWGVGSGDPAEIVRERERQSLQQKLLSKSLDGLLTARRLGDD